MSNNRADKVVVHVGYPKAASTSLQKHLFDRHPQIRNLGMFPTGNVGEDSDYINENCEFLSNPQLQSFYDNLVMLEGIEYENSNNDELFQNHISGLLKSTDKTVIFSNERFVSVFYAHDDLREKANRLRTLMGEVKILFIIRNQASLIKSQYRDHPFDPRSFAIGSPVSLKQWVKIARNSSSVNFLESLRYFDVVRYYTKLFGEDQVGVFTLERLANDTAEFAESISEFLEINPDRALELLQVQRENTGVSKWYNDYRRIKRITPDVKRLLPHPVKLCVNQVDSIIERKARGGPKEELTLSGELKSMVNSLYAESNRRLGERHGLNLQEYQYPM